MPSSDLRKAAIVLTSLPQDLAAQLLARLEPKEVEAVSIEIAKLGSVSAEEQEQVIRDFVNASPAAGGGNVGGLEVAKALVEKALGKAAGATLESVRQAIETLPFGFLQKVDTQNLVTFLMDEHPQTIALVLAHLNPSQAATILSALPPDRQVAVIRRIANMNQTSPEIIKDVEDALAARVANLVNQHFEKAGGVDAVAEILNVVDRATERTILEYIGQDDPELVEQIRRRMFVFEDIVKLSDRDIQTVLKHVESSQWATALKGASEELKQKILNNMSKRAAALLLEEMEYLGPVRASVVEQVQQQIVDTIRKLEEAGEIAIQRQQEEERYLV
ncbi:MAG: flagellar motor switch protein FliG [Thermoguttaceae bacterium]|nr:flagellar motor switch protein FliG [Thermoguttaceae bacterium]MDW8079457.1 flagellar motor switch protein FliG [Thermoguttaceae bacterium]